MTTQKKDPLAALTNATTTLAGEPAPFRSLHHETLAALRAIVDRLDGHDTAVNSLIESRERIAARVTECENRLEELDGEAPNRGETIKREPRHDQKAKRTGLQTFADYLAKRIDDAEQNGGKRMRVNVRLATDDLCRLVQLIDDLTPPTLAVDDDADLPGEWFGDDSEGYRFYEPGSAGEYGYSLSVFDGGWRRWGDRNDIVDSDSGSSIEASKRAAMASLKAARKAGVK